MCFLKTITNIMILFSYYYVDIIFNFGLAHFKIFNIIHFLHYNISGSITFFSFLLLTLSRYSGVQSKNATYKCLTFSKSCMRYRYCTLPFYWTFFVWKCFFITLKIISSKERSPTIVDFPFLSNLKAWRMRFVLCRYLEVLDLSVI